MDLFREILLSLTRDEQLACLWHVAGFSTGEIAAQLGIRRDQAGRLLRETLRKVRRLLGRE